MFGLELIPGLVEDIAMLNEGLKRLEAQLNQATRRRLSQKKCTRLVYRVDRLTADTSEEVLEKTRTYFVAHPTMTNAWFNRFKERDPTGDQQIVEIFYQEEVIDP